MLIRNYQKIIDHFPSSLSTISYILKKNYSLLCGIYLKVQQNISDVW